MNLLDFRQCGMVHCVVGSYTCHQETTCFVFKAVLVCHLWHGCVKPILKLMIWVWYTIYFDCASFKPLMFATSRTVSQTLHFLKNSVRYRFA